jgi:ATP-dependent Clp protease ATP-binding subunit ClpX
LDCKLISLDELDEKALVEILTKPKNALTKQYAKLFEYDDVALEFEEGALEAIAQEAIKRNTGARGLRAILEQSMLEVMYELPAKSAVKKCIVTKNTVLKGERPMMLLDDGTDVSKQVDGASASKAESA